MNTHRKLTTLIPALLLMAASAVSADIYTSTPEAIRASPWTAETSMRWT